MDTRIKRWMGGSVPPEGFPATPDEIALYEKLLNEQLEVWRGYWGDEPDADTLETFKGRARYDAWATLRPTTPGWT